jgi:hypothetical protein
VEAAGDGIKEIPGGQQLFALDEYLKLIVEVFRPIGAKRPAPLTAW